MLNQKIEGLNCFYRVEGIGKPIVLLHGWGQSHSFWDELYPVLIKKYTVYALDLPGFGQSDEPQEVWGIEDYSDFLQKFVKKLNINNFVLIGHSFGGRIAVVYSVENKTIKKLILYSASGLNKSHNLAKKIIYFLLTIFSAIFPILSYSLQSKLFKPSTYKNKIKLNMPRSKIMNKISIKTHQLDLTEFAKKIVSPTLLIYGKSDWIVPSKVGYEYNTLIQKSKLEIIPHAGHFSHIENKDSFLKVLNEFLDFKN